MTDHRDDIDRLAAERPPSLYAELVGLLKKNKKWWVIPILVVVLLLGALVILGGSGAAPFVYTLF